MAWFSYYHHSFITFLIFILVVFLKGVTAATFIFINRCDYTVWPGIQAHLGRLEPESTGFELAKGRYRSFQASTRWSGKFWGRTSCKFGDSVNGSCDTGDCGTGQVECSGADPIPPATLVETSINSVSQDFYVVSLLQGYNLPILVEGIGGSGDCPTTGCVEDFNGACPSELRIDGRAACKSPCDAFRRPEYCCTGSYSSPAACRPSIYSELFKSACPRSYTYLYDDATSTFNCTGADYTITFCPTSRSTLPRPVPAYVYHYCHDARFECGNITAEYPFIGGERGEDCGRRGLQLYCDADTPKIDTLDVPYKVLGIDRDRQVLRIARENLINNGFCSPQVRNSPLDSQLFNASAYSNLTLFFDCHRSTSSIIRLFSCNVTEGIGPSYKNVSVMVGNIRPEGCASNVTVPILQTSMEALRSSSLRLEEALEAGFEVQWKEDREACRRCENSSGTCGFDRDNQTICYCPFPLVNRQGAKECHLPPPARTHQQGTVGSTVAIVAVFLCLIFIWRKRLIIIWKKKLREKQNAKAFIEEYESLVLKRYSYSEVKKMTKTFKHKLGQGGYGSVYRGELHNGQLIAVKVLSESKGNGEDFINEVASISRTSHVNIVTLLGFCYEGSKRALIYDYMPNGSLDKFIYENKRLDAGYNLEWRTLYQITVGIARGLEYLHQGCNTRILHFDIKPHNILLDQEFRPKISDFGLAKLCRRKESIVSMIGARGTAGYMAPELWNRSFGGVSYKSDVYSFGMMVLEIVGGRKNIDAAVSHTSEIYFPDWIYKQLELGQDLKLHGVVTEDDERIARKMILVSLWCIQISPSDRPSMTKVVEMLEGSLESLQAPPQPFLSSPVREQQNSSQSETS
ncbi:hypothetical protein PTKIN_Ptkin09bG0249100 [Pterospermum kingtungense]